MEEIGGSSRRAFLASLLAALAFAAVLLPSLGRTRLMDVDEVIHSRAALEAARDGHWLPLTIEGRPWWEKPPLWPWLAALSIKAGLQQELALRLMPALSAVLALFFFARLSLALLPLLPGLALSAAFACQPDLLFHGRFFTMDTGLVACMLAALWGLWCAAENPGKAHRHAWAAGLAMGLAAAIKSYFSPAILIPLSLGVWHSAAFEGRRARVLFRIWLPAVLVLAAWLGTYAATYGASFLVQEWEVNLMGRATRNIAMDAGLWSNWLFYYWCADNAIPLLLPAWLLAGLGLWRPAGLKRARQGRNGADFLRLCGAVFIALWTVALLLVRTQNINYITPLTPWICLGLGLLALDLPLRQAQAFLWLAAILGLANVLRWPGEPWPLLIGLLAAPLSLIAPASRQALSASLSAALALLGAGGLFQGWKYFSAMPDPNRKVVESVLQNPPAYPGETLNYYGHWTDSLLFYSRYKVAHHGPLKGQPKAPAMIELGDRSVVFLRGKK